MYVLDNDSEEKTQCDVKSFPPQFKCCGSNDSRDWMASAYVSSKQAEDRVVPDSCCKTITPHCGKRDHPSNIYKVEVSGLPWEAFAGRRDATTYCTI